MLLHGRTGARLNIDMRLFQFEFVEGHTRSVHLQFFGLFNGLVGIVLLSLGDVL